MMRRPTIRLLIAHEIDRIGTSYTQNSGGLLDHFILAGTAALKSLIGRQLL